METKIITVGNMKGGVGKSTLTSIFANHCHNDLKIPVCVIDADDLQQTINTIRQDEIKAGADEAALFPVLVSNSKDAPAWIARIIDDYDNIFIDLPGNLKQEGVINSYLRADLIIIPTSLSKEDIDATMKFIDILEEKVIPARKEMGLSTTVIGLLHKVRKFGKEYKSFKQIEDQMPIKFFKEVVPPSDQLMRLTSTIRNIKYDSKTFDINNLLSEFDEVLKEVR